MPKKIDKVLQVDIFTRKFQEPINRHFIEIQVEGEQESLFILINITDFIDFDKERATAHTGVGNKHSSEINEDVQAEQRKNSELNKLENFPNKADMSPLT